MTPKQLIEMLETIPESMREMDLMFFSTDDGAKFVARTDVAQFSNIYRGKLKLFIRKVED